MPPGGAIARAHGLRPPLLVERCIDPQPGWQVLVATTTEARPVAQELSRLLAERGAYALTRIAFGAPFPADLDWIAAAPAELAATLPPLERHVLEEVDGTIFVLAPGARRDSVSTTTAHARFRAHVSAYRDRGRSGQIPSVRCDFPCPAYAERAGLTLAEFEDVFYEACLRDWDEEGRGWNRCASASTRPASCASSATGPTCA